MQTINSLIDIAYDTDVFFIDVYGVLWSGEKFYEPALSVCEKLMQMGKKIYILSNATTISSHFKEKHHTNGFVQGVHYTDVITSGDVMKDMLENENLMDKVTGKKNGKYLLIGRPNDRLLESVLLRQTLNPKEAKAVYFGSPTLEKGEYFTDTSYFEPQMQKALDKNLTAICSNPDYFAFHGNLKHITQGSLGKWYEEHGGTVCWIGKPYQNIYEYALKKANETPAKSVMVGDTIRTDILGGKNAGMKTVLILKTGITQDLLDKGATLMEIEEMEGAVPDYILEGLK